MADRTRNDRISIAFPWWQAAVLAVAVGLLGIAVGKNLGGPSAPGEGSVDVGFLQDMRLHHDQAVQMSILLIDKPKDTIDPTIRQLAANIVLEQQLENGLMVEMLRNWGRKEQNESGTVMGWMGHSTPADKMEGIASAADIDKLTNATGAAATKLWATLMMAHHLGGQHMAEYAASNASTKDVQDLARPMGVNQLREIKEIQLALDKVNAK